MELKKEAYNIGDLIDHYQEWVDYDMKHFGKISDETNRDIKEAGLQVVKDEYGDYEVIAGKYDDKSFKEDVVKKANGKWTNRGDDGKEHGEFDTKAEAEAQMRAMYARGYKGESIIDKQKLKIDEDQLNNTILEKDFKVMTTDEFLKWHDDPENYQKYPYKFEAIYEIFDENGFSENDDVDVNYNNLSHEDQIRVTSIIKDSYFYEDVNSSGDDYKVYRLSMDVAVPNDVNLRRVGFDEYGGLRNSIADMLKEKNLKLVSDWINYEESPELTKKYRDIEVIDTAIDDAYNENTLNEDVLDTAQMSFETGHRFKKNDFENKDEFNKYLELMDLGPAGFYEEYKDILEFDPDFVSEYGENDD